MNKSNISYILKINPLTPKQFKPHSDAHKFITISVEGIKGKGTPQNY